MNEIAPFDFLCNDVPEYDVSNINVSRTKCECCGIERLCYIYDCNYLNNMTYNPSYCLWVKPINLCSKCHWLLCNCRTAFFATQERVMCPWLQKIDIHTSCVIKYYLIQTRTVDCRPITACIHFWAILPRKSWVNLTDTKYVCKICSEHSLYYIPTIIYKRDLIKPWRQIIFSYLHGCH